MCDCQRKAFSGLKARGLQPFPAYPDHWKIFLEKWSPCSSIFSVRVRFGDSCAGFVFAGSSMILLM
jgi:hypothetical protein